MEKDNRGLRSITNVVTSIRTIEGGGIVVRRPFPTQSQEQVDPFLLLDHMGPMELKPGEGTGVPAHPHRGFETVTYMLSGTTEHKDSQGNKGVLRPGDVQWMTAGAGVVHSEMMEENFRRTGGTLHGLQLWVNLPQSNKMMKPRYQDLRADQIPTGRSDDGLVEVKVISGQALGKRSNVETIIPIIYLHFTLQPGAQMEQAIPANLNTLAYVIEGHGLFGKESKKASEGQMVQFNNDGDSVAFSVPSTETSALSLVLLAGQPLNEPMARYGPFVMNTMGEIKQAIVDYEKGEMGKISF